MNFKIILAISGVVALILAIGIIFWFRTRIVALEKEFKDFDDKNEDDLGGYKPIVVGELKNMLETDYSKTMITFIVNTIGRNNFKTFWVDEHSGNTRSVGKIIEYSNAKKSSSKFDLFIHEYKEEDSLIEVCEKFGSKIKSNGMALIINLPKKNSSEIKLQEFLKDNFRWFKYQKIEIGVLIIAK